MPFDFMIEQGKLEEFARAVGSDNPSYFVPGAVIPPTFLTTPLHFFGSSDDRPHETLGFDNARVLHAEEEYIFHGQPPRAGVQLTATSRLEDQYEKQGRRGGIMRFAVTVTEFRDPSGVLVAERRGTAIETGQPPQEGTS